MNLQLPRAYTLTLALAMVIGPFVWLTLTEDGRRRTDLALLHLLGRPAFNLAVPNLTPAITEAEVAARFGGVRFDCREQAGQLGDRRCVAVIGSFNGVPARSAQLFYRAGGLSAVRLDYQPRWHDFLTGLLRTDWGPATRTEDGVQVWAFAGGRAFLPVHPPPAPDAALLWLAAEAD